MLILEKTALKNAFALICARTPYKNIAQKTSSGTNKLLFQRLKSVCHLSLQCSIFNCYVYSDNAFSSKLKLNWCGLVNHKIIFLSVINLIESSFISANKSIYSFNCWLNRWFQINILNSTLWHAVSYRQRISESHEI